MTDSPKSPGSMKSDGRRFNGHNPNSQANLKSWKPGENGTVGRTGPLVTPHMRRFAQLGGHEFLNIALDKLRVGEMIAWTFLFDSLQSTPTSARSREQVLDRLDGPLPKPVELNDNRIQVVIQQYGGIKPEEIA